MVQTVLSDVFFTNLSILCRYPDFTTEEILQGYRGDICRGIAKDRLKAFIQRVVANSSCTKEGTQAFVNLYQGDCLELDHENFASQIPDFKGSDLVFLDMPKVRNDHFYLQYLFAGIALNFNYKE